MQCSRFRSDRLVLPCCGHPSFYSFFSGGSEKFLQSSCSHPPLSPSSVLSCPPPPTHHSMPFALLSSFVCLFCTVLMFCCGLWSKANDPKQMHGIQPNG